MVNKFIAIGAGVTVVIVLIVGIYFSQQVQQREALQNVQISLGGINLKSLGLTSAILGLSLNMYNPNNSVTATLDRTEYQLYANGNELANGEIPNRYDIPPTSTVTVPTDVTVSYLDSLGTVFSALKNGVVNWEMKGISYFEMPILGTVSVPYDFQKTSQFSNNANQGSNSYQGTNSYQQNPQQRQASQQPVQQPTIQTISPVTAVNYYFDISAGTIQYLTFNIPCTSTMNLNFQVDNWNLEQNIVVTIMDDNNFKITQNDPSTHNYSQVYWSNGEKGHDVFSSPVASGTYHITMSNLFDHVNTKLGNIFVSYTCSS